MLSVNAYEGPQNDAFMDLGRDVAVAPDEVSNLWWRTKLDDQASWRSPRRTSTSKAESRLASWYARQGRAWHLTCRIPERLRLEMMMDGAGIAPHARSHLKP